MRNQLPVRSATFTGARSPKGSEILQWALLTVTKFFCGAMFRA
jgi:hypothetical protein